MEVREGTVFWGGPAQEGSAQLMATTLVLALDLSQNVSLRSLEHGAVPGREGTFPGEATNGCTFDLEGYDLVHASEMDHMTSDMALSVKISCGVLGKEHALVLDHGDGCTTLYIATLSLTEFYGVCLYMAMEGLLERKSAMKRETHCRERLHQTSDLELEFAESPCGGKGDEGTY